jgi:hypothetical protein
MMTYLNKWIRQTEDNVELKDDIHPMMSRGNKVWIPDYGWQYC